MEPCHEPRVISLGVFRECFPGKMTLMFIEIYISNYSRISTLFMNIYDSLLPKKRNQYHHVEKRCWWFLAQRIWDGWKWYDGLNIRSLYIYIYIIDFRVPTLFCYHSPSLNVHEFVLAVGMTHSCFAATTASAIGQQVLNDVLIEEEYAAGHSQHFTVSRFDCGYLFYHVEIETSAELP